MNAAPIASESGHWYRQDGSPCYQVPYADVSKGMRNTTKTDAKKLNLVPSTTKIIGVADKPGLRVWRDNQLLDAALTLPMLEGELADAYKLRIIADADERGKKARDRGTELHAAIEKFICTDLNNDPAWMAHIDNLFNTLNIVYGIDITKGNSEHSFARDGYGGKIDWHNDELLLDFKSKDRIDDKVKPHDDHLMQCAAYAHGLGLKRAGNVFIGVEDKQVRVFLYEPEQLSEAFGMFASLLSFWQRKNRFGIYAKPFRVIAYEIGHHLDSTRLSRSYGSVIDKKQQFRDYFQQWKDETGGMSSLTDITGNENYLNIISLGEDVVPDILKELQKDPLPLFLALRVLTKEKNVGTDHSGDFRAIAREWIKWGKEHNKLER